jgi:hypothetical protein
MPRLAKKLLRQVVLDALKISGYAIEQAGVVHPFEITVVTLYSNPRISSFSE